jgi:hypothetical protein
MAKIIRFPGRHAEASVPTGGLRPKMRGSADLPRRVISSDKLKKYSAGILPRALQLDTAGAPTPASAAAAAVPPKASTMASTVASMPLDNSRAVKMSSVHELPVENLGEPMFHRAMANRLRRPVEIDPRSDEAVMIRLRILQKAFGPKAKDIAEKIDRWPSAWSQYTKPGPHHRELTLETAHLLCDKFKVSLDWLFRDDDTCHSGPVNAKLDAARRSLLGH